MIDESTKIAGGTIGGLLFAWGCRLLLKMFSRDGVDRAKDRGEIDFVARQAARIKELEDGIASMAKERNEAIVRESIAVSRVGGLEARVESLRETVHALNLRVEELMQDIHLYRGKGGEQWPR